MKKMYILLIVLVVLAVLVTIFDIKLPISAAEIDPSLVEGTVPTDPETDTSAPETPVTDETDSPAIEESTFKQWLNEWKASYEAEQATAEEPSTFAEWILLKAWDKLAEILAGLAAVCASLNMIYSRRKTKQQDAISKKTSDNLTKFTNDMSSIVETSNKNSADALAITQKFESYYEQIKAEQKILAENQKQLDKDRKALAAAMKVQSEMLNTVIQSSTLTQWKKDQIGQLYADATKHIAVLEKKNGGDVK
jgi:hypothetical protein